MRNIKNKNKIQYEHPLRGSIFFKGKAQLNN